MLHNGRHHDSGKRAEVQLPTDPFEGLPDASHMAVVGAGVFAGVGPCVDAEVFAVVFAGVGPCVSTVVFAGVGPCVGAGVGACVGAGVGACVGAGVGGAGVGAEVAETSGEPPEPVQMVVPPSPAAGPTTKVTHAGALDRLPSVAWKHTTAFVSG